jgi:hypothetical protein
MVTIEGTAMYSGHLSGCTVFLDLDLDGVHSASEPSGLTTPYGRYELAVMSSLELADLNVVVKTGDGCKDASTGLDLGVEMTVKATCATKGPTTTGGMANLITAVSSLLKHDPLSESDAAAQRSAIISTAMGLTDFDACTYDPLLYAWSGAEAAGGTADAFGSFIQTNIELTTLVKTLSDVTGYSNPASYQLATKAIIQGIATAYEDFAAGTAGRRLAASGGLSLANPAAITKLIHTASAATGADFGDNSALVGQVAGSTAVLVQVLAEQVKEVVADVTAGQAAPSGGADLVSTALKDLAKASVVSQNANAETALLLKGATTDEIFSVDFKDDVREKSEARAATFLQDIAQAVVPPAVQAPSPMPPPPPADPPPPPTPSPPPPTLPAPAPSPPYISPRPSTESVVLSFTAAGTVDGWTRTDSSQLRRAIAQLAHVPAGAVSIVVAAASVLVTATIAVPPTTTAAAVQTKLASALASKELATAALGITVESDLVITIPTQVENEDSTDQDKDKMYLLVLLLLVPPILCMAYVLVAYNGKEFKYLSYRFSHANPFMRVGYMPKERRDALWAELKAPKASARTSESTNVAGEADSKRNVKTDRI